MGRRIRSKEERPPERVEDHLGHHSGSAFPASRSLTYFSAAGLTMARIASHNSSVTSAGSGVHA